MDVSVNAIKDLSLSVVVPVHGTDSELFARCLESISAAWDSPSRLELIVVFDGAPSIDLVSAVSSFSGGSTKVIEQVQSGVSSARNTGLSHARARWVAFVDSDDALPPLSLRHLVCYGEDHACDVVFGNHRKVMPSGEEAVLYSRECIVPSDSFKARLQHDVLNPTKGASPLWGKVYRRDTIEHFGIRFNESLRIGEDTDFVFRLLSVSERPGFICECTYIYYRNDSSSTMSFNRGYADDVVRSMRAMSVNVSQLGDAEAYSDDLATYCLFHLMLIMVHYVFNSKARWSASQQKRAYSCVLDEAIFRDSLDRRGPSGFGISRNIMIFSMKHRIFCLSKAISAAREMQMRGRK